MFDPTYFRNSADKLLLTRAGPMPIRRAQLGALHSIGAHFAVHDDAAIIALPTGVGKSAVAAAAPFVVPDVQRVLYVVPTKVLRQDAVANLSEQSQLRAIALLSDEVPNPTVLEVDRRPSSWSDLEKCDVAVALPNALFDLIEDSPPPRDLFDLIIFDEAHHVPARTWEMVSTAFDARKVLLTATPYRRDSRELPGTVVFNYPLSRAIADGAYVPIDLVGVEAIGKTEAERDRLIGERAVRLMREEHAGTTSRLLVRASTKKRAEGLVELYAELGVHIHVVHSGLTPTTVEKRIAEVRAGDVDGIAFVGVLGEGFDCPELKVGAYHDKHKSLPVTLQFLGRLSRVCKDAGKPQVVASVETLRGDTWSLWRRDSDWASIVPKLAETATADVSRRKDLIAGMDEFPRDDVSLADIVLRPSFGLYEVVKTALADEDDGFEFGLDSAGVAAIGLTTDSRFGGDRIVWSHLNEKEQLLLFVTSHVERPDWLRSRSLDTERFEMHVVLVREGADTQPVVVVSSTTRKREAGLMELLTGAADGYRLASPDLMRRFLSVAEIGNIQHLGTRNSAGRGQARSYTTNSGKAVEDGLAYEDLRDDVVGHVGAQCHIDGNDYNGGVSISNSRIWVIKRFPIEGYVDFVSGVLRQMGAGQPGGIRRLTARFEQALHTWPTSTEPIAVALDGYFYTDVDVVGECRPVDLDIRALPADGDVLPLEIPVLGWAGSLRTNGTFAASSPVVEAVTTSGRAELESLLLQYPPTIYFRDGSSTRGQRLVPSPTLGAQPPLEEILDDSWDWSSTNIKHEIPRTGRTDSVHEKVESELAIRFPSSWIIGDDGSGEIADHIVVEPIDGDHVELHLFHSKATREDAPGIRTKDVDEMVAQIARSKRWTALADRDFWERLATRINQRASTRLLSGPGDGSVPTFLDACRSWSDRPPMMSVHYVGVQPGLDVRRLAREFDADPNTHPRMAETIGACAAWVGGPHSTLRIVGS